MSIFLALRPLSGADLTIGRRERTGQSQLRSLCHIAGYVERRNISRGASYQISRGVHADGTQRTLVMVTLKTAKAKLQLLKKPRKKALLMR